VTPCAGPLLLAIWYFVPQHEIGKDLECSLKFREVFMVPVLGIALLGYSQFLSPEFTLASNGSIGEIDHHVRNGNWFARRFTRAMMWGSEMSNASVIDAVKGSSSTPTMG
jgi:hypothetical protein